MPKTKAAKNELEEKKPAEEMDEKIIEIDEDDALEDDELADDEDSLGDLDEEVLDEEEVDPFNDKWEQ